jgi:hypothetical protein
MKLHSRVKSTKTYGIFNVKNALVRSACHFQSYFQSRISEPTRILTKGSTWNMQESVLCVASKGQISSCKRHLQLADRFLFSPWQIFCHSKSPRANSCQSIQNSITHWRGKPDDPRVRWCHLQVLFILQINVLAVWMELSALLVRIIQIPGLILDPVTAYSKQVSHIHVIPTRWAAMQ